MPVKKVNVGSKVRYKWGNKGKAYPTRAQAVKQGIAIKLSKKK